MQLTLKNGVQTENSVRVVGMWKERAAELAGGGCWRSI